jgi:hypothetical protein
MPYGAYVDDGAYSEWMLVILFTSRQDGRTAWSVSLVEVDGSVSMECGMSRTECGVVDVEIERSINRLTSRWIAPLNA